jgi:hypothetical protein
MLFGYPLAFTRHLFLEKFQLFSNQYPALGLFSILTGALLVGGLGLFRINYMLQEKEISLNTQRFQILMGMLQKDNAESANPLYLELAFQRTFRRKKVVTKLSLL